MNNIGHKSIPNKNSLHLHSPPQKKIEKQKKQKRKKKNEKENAFLFLHITPPN